MKSDFYLNLCLEQAARSPIHFSHGCVVVKGGKVIGQGYNDYRPAYDGASVLKTGVLPKAPCCPLGPGRLPDHALADHRGGGGGGHHANARLSMHSEMMAINSALKASATLAASTLPSLRPTFKLPGDTKRKRALRRGRLAAYVRATCQETLGQDRPQGTAQAQADEWRFEKPATYRCDENVSESEDEAWLSETSPESSESSESQ